MPDGVLRALPECFVHDEEETVWSEHDLPDYLHDLNAMHEAEKTLGNLLHGYWAELWNVCEPNCPFRQTRTHWDYADFDNIGCATASQRAEAFLRTIGKWKD